MRILIIAMLFVSNMAFASEKCEMFSEFAEEAVKAKYNGVPLREAMAAVDGEIYKAVIRDAYKLPDYMTEEMQRREQVNFGNEVYEFCISELV